MIKCKGSHTSINGGILVNLNDFANIIVALRKMLYRKMPEEVADKCIMTTVKIAYTEDGTEKMESLVEELQMTVLEGYHRRGEIGLS